MTSPGTRAAISICAKPFGSLLQAWLHPPIRLLIHLGDWARGPDRWRVRAEQSPGNRGLSATAFNTGVDTLRADEIDDFASNHEKDDINEDATDSASYVTQHRAEFAAIVAAKVEIGTIYDQGIVAARPDHVSLEPPQGWRNPVTGRRDLHADPRLVRLGRYLRRARSFVGASQQRLADASGVTQSIISRAEGAQAPAMQLERLAALAEVLGRAFPLGVCPHDHECAWQPIKPPEHHTTDVERLPKLILETGSD